LRLGARNSNLAMPESKSGALSLGYAPSRNRPLDGRTIRINGWSWPLGAVSATIKALQAAGQEVSGTVFDHTAGTLSPRVRCYATRLIVFEIGHAAIGLCSGRLAVAGGKPLRAAAWSADHQGTAAAGTRVSNRAVVPHGRRASLAFNEVH
jgi:hypothetical protein